jgi:hypothetical protein
MSRVSSMLISRSLVQPTSIHTPRGGRITAAINLQGIKGTWHRGWGVW